MYILIYVDCLNAIKRCVLMAYDGLLAKAVTRELKEFLPDSKIDKISQPEIDQIVLNIRGMKGHFKLLMDISAAGGRTTFTNMDFENPKEPPAFCMLLRKHIQGGRINDVYQIDNERIIILDIETVNEMGYSVNKKLVCESLGRLGNIILVDGVSGKIIDCSRRILTDECQILPGMIFETPSKAKLSNNLGYGKSTSIAVEMGANPDEINPSVWVDENNNPKDVHVINLVQYEGKYNRLRFESIAEALDYYYSNRLESNHVLQKKANFEKQVKGIADKYISKKAKLLDEIKKSDEAEIYRVKGELINANLHLLKAGQKKVELNNYYDGSVLTVELDEKLSPAKNGQAFFKKYSKLKASKKEKLIQLEECENNISYLESVVSSISLSDTYAQMDLIKQELFEQGFIRFSKAEARNKKIKPKAETITLAGGKTVLVGSSNLENDYVTFKLAKKGDYWLHTKDIHGAHVILQCEGDEPSHQDIREAAEVAAWFSKGRLSSTVPVDYVPIKYVKKPNGARPGMVIFTNNKTIYVDPTSNPRDI